MPTPALRRSLRWRGPQRTISVQFRVIVAAAAPLGVLAMAPTALAHSAALAPTALLSPTPLPSVCVGGVLLCGGQGANLTVTISPVPLPTPCLAGTVLCNDPLPLPSNPILGPTTTTPPGAPGPAPAQPQTSTPAGGHLAPASTAPAGPADANLALREPLPAPPGVGLVDLPRVVVDGGLAPGSLATVLSLSLRDGLGPGRYHVWPWLLAVQLALWTAIAAAVRFQPSSRSPGARRP